jgi:hypothetical protein
MLFTIFSTYLYSWFFGVSKKQILQESQLPQIEPLQIEIKRSETQKTTIEIELVTK